MSAQSGERRLALAFLTPTLVWLAAFFAAPFAVMALLSVARMQGRIVVQGLFPDNYVKFFTDPALFKGLTVSLEITLTVTVLSVLLAYPLAWLLVLGQNGVINKALLTLGAIAEPLALASTRTATVIGFVHFFVMLLTLTIYANLIQLPPNYARAAADLGATAFATFRHIILPLTLPGVVTGAFLTFVLCVGDYITPQILGGNNELTLPQLIMMQLGRRGDFPMASALSLILMSVVTIAYLACARWLRLDRL